MAGTGIFHRVSGNQAFVYGSLHAVAYPCACYEEGGERWRGRGRDEEMGEEGVEEGTDRRRGRSESDRETERLFNGVELVIGALGLKGGREGVGELRGVRGAHGQLDTLHTPESV